LIALFEKIRLVLGFVALVTFTSWVSGAIVLAGADLIRVNPLRFVGTDIWKTGILIAGIFAFLGLWWV